MAPNPKSELIEEHFKQWDRDLTRAKELLDGKHYYLEGLLALSCHIGAFAAMRYPALKDGPAYVKIVLEYSGKRDFYEQIDLLFLFQWPKSKFGDHGHYKELKNHPEIVASLAAAYGTEDELTVTKPYVKAEDIVNVAKAAAIPGFDEKNLREKLQLFSLAEMLYRYMRCGAVHNSDFSFVRQSMDSNGNLHYKEWHAITGIVLYETAQGIANTLGNECLAKEKWPHQL